MHRRANCVQQLEMEDTTWRDVVIMPAMATVAVCGSQCGSLLTLRIAAVDVGLAGAGIAALAVFTRLRHLEVWAMTSQVSGYRVRLLMTYRDCSRTGWAAARGWPPYGQSLRPLT